jgi:zinc transporter ZupT
MGPIDLIFHLLSFAVPAFAVGLAVALGARLILPRRPDRRAWWQDTALNFVAGVGVLAAGLWYFGVDGKMYTYAALVLAVASTQWLFGRAWKA